MMVVLLIIVIISLLYWFFMSPFSQLFGKFVYRAKTQEKIVAITFDDGPNSPYTEQILDILKEEKVKATFFVVGECAIKYPNIVKRINNEGHIIGNHSYSHSFFKYILDPSFKNQISKNQDIINKIIKKTPRLFRPPWLFRTPLLLRSIKKLDMEAISGEFCHELEVLQIGSKRIAKRTIDKVKPGSIIIFHDGVESRGGNRAQTVDAVRIVIKSLKNRNYKFLTIDKLLHINAYK